MITAQEFLKQKKVTNPLVDTFCKRNGFGTVNIEEILDEFVKLNLPKVSSMFKVKIIKDIEELSVKYDKLYGGMTMIDIGEVGWDSEINIINAKIEALEQALNYG